jgi:hypothetical protein
MNEFGKTMNIYQFFIDIYQLPGIHGNSNKAPNEVRLYVESKLL